MATLKKYAHEEVRWYSLPNTKRRAVAMKLVALRFESALMSVRYARSREGTAVLGSTFARMGAYVRQNGGACPSTKEMRKLAIPFSVRRVKNKGRFNIYYPHGMDAKPGKRRWLSSFPCPE